MRELVLELMGEYGNLAVFLLILVENLFPPIPSEVILTFGGVMTTCTDMTPGGVILFSTAGSMAGAVILYGAGRFLPDEIFRKLLCGKAGQLLHFRPEDVDLAKDWFRDRGKSAVFLCRLVPIVRSLISIPAGIASRFLLSRRRGVFCGIRFSSMQAGSPEIPGRRCQLRSGCTQISF